MKRRLVLMGALATALLCGCEETRQTRSYDVEIERARAQIAAKADEKQRLDVDLRKKDKLVIERGKLEVDYKALREERSKLLAQLKPATGRNDATKGASRKRRTP